MRVCCDGLLHFFMKNVYRNNVFHNSYQQQQQQQFIYYENINNAIITIKNN